MSRSKNDSLRSAAPSSPFSLMTYENINLVSILYGIGQCSMLFLTKIELLKILII